MVRGVTRKIDKLGRVTIPAEYRELLQIGVNDVMYVYLCGKKVVLRSIEEECQLCYGAANLGDYNGYKICHDCFRKLRDKFVYGN